MEGSQNVEEDSLMKAIKFYQSGLHRYMERNDEFKMLHSLSKLSRYPIKVSHLKETGVGRTVNLLVKIEGKVGEEANTLINKWKEMVEKEKADQDSSDNASQNSPPNQPQYEENSDERYSKYKKSSNDRSESDEEQNSKAKSQAEKENRSTERHGTRKEHESNRSNDHKRQESSDRYKHKSSHDRRENKHSTKSEKERLSRHEKEDDDERSSKDKDRDNDERREKEKDMNRGSDRRHKENGEKGKKEKEERKGKEHKNHREKDRSERNGKEERNHEEIDINERREKVERSHKEKDRKKEDDDKKDKDKKSSSSSSGKKDKTSSSKNHRSEISSESGTSFADALGMMEIPRKHKKSDKKESASSSKHLKNNVLESPVKERKCDKKESSSSSRHNKAEKSPKFRDSSGMVDATKKERKSDKKERHHKSEISSESGTSFEDALGKLETPKKEKKATKRENSVLHDSEICSSSGTSFEAALGMMEVPKKKKKFSDRQVERSPSPVEDVSPVLPLPTVPLDKIDLNISSLLPSITPNYRPIRVLDSKHPINDLETLNSFMTNKHQRTKIYSGNKSFYAKVPSLFDICVQLLQIHIDAIEGTGGVPYSILKPVLDKATPNQLLRLEYYNSYLTEDSDELWQLHCQKDFRREKRGECETWREMYTRCTEEREMRLLTLTANIKQSREKSVPVRQTKIAYIDPPSRNTSRRQVKHLPSAPMARAKVESMVRDSKASSDVVVTHHVKAARGFAAASSSSSSSSGAASSGSAGTSSSQAKIKKIAPLMAKSLSAFKNRFKR